MDRCLNCANKPCMNACPVNCSPQEFISHAKNGDFEQAVATITRNNPMGQTCGLICPDKFCMKACTRSRIDFAVNIPKVQATILENYRNPSAEAKAIRPNGRKVAVIGAGPAGLAAAAELGKQGYYVCLYEASDKIGGALNMIPDERLPYEVIAKDWSFIFNRDFITLYLTTKIGSPSDLFSQGFDGVIVATGEPNVTDLGIPGQEYAVSYMEYLHHPSKYETKGRVAVIGGGPAGLAAAYSAWQHGLRDILILERDAELGGILNQCIHNGFGLHRFGQQLTGPEYAGRYIEMLRTTGVRVELGTMVLEVTPDKQVHCVSRSKGYQIIQAKSIILCMGCRERTRGAIGTPGTRPAGIYTAGAAQRYVNMEGYLVGRRVLILGSGDIGLIMARRMTLEGAKVLACVEVMPYSGGLTRNIVQCLQDFDIPLYLSHTIVEIQGKKRVEKAIVAKVDENRRSIPGTQMEFDVDTILLSVGLIPENELTRQAGIAMDPHTKGAVVYENMETEIPGVFACGNVVHVHDLVDFVSGESETAGAAAAAYVQNGEIETEIVLPLAAGEGIGYTVPQHIRLDGVQKSVSVSFRVRRNYGPSTITVRCGPNKIAAFKRERLAPGEMEHITLPKALLQKADGPLIVAVEEVPQS